MLKTVIKIPFNANNSEHLMYRDYLHSSSWKNGCPFALEWPYTDIPKMISDAIINEHLDQIIDIRTTK